MSGYRTHWLAPATAATTAAKTMNRSRPESFALVETSAILLPPQLFLLIPPWINQDPIPEKLMGAETVIGIPRHCNYFAFFANFRLVPGEFKFRWVWFFSLIPVVVIPTKAAARAFHIGAVKPGAEVFLPLDRKSRHVMEMSG